MASQHHPELSRILQFLVKVTPNRARTSGRAWKGRPCWSFSDDANLRRNERQFALLAASPDSTKASPENLLVCHPSLTFTGQKEKPHIGPKHFWNTQY